MILLKLILAHLLGDFLLQPNSWVAAKQKQKILAWQMYVHAFIHFALIIVLVYQKEFIKWAALLAAMHLIVDILKSYVQKDQTKRLWFFADQLFHFSIILLVWSWSQSTFVIAEILRDGKFLLLITCIYALSQPVSVLIHSVISRWKPDTISEEPGSLENAGKYIGILERLFVFAFTVTGNWAAIGFLLTAKSVFRFGDLKESKDRKLTEYVLIGTLLSFGIAFLIGIIYSYVEHDIITYSRQYFFNSFIS